METKTKIIIGVSALVLLVGTTVTYKYFTSWRYEDGDMKIENGKWVSSFSKQDNNWTPVAKMGLDQSAIDKTNEKFAKSPNGIYRKGVKVF